MKKKFLAIPSPRTWECSQGMLKFKFKEMKDHTSTSVLHVARYNLLQMPVWVQVRYWKLRNSLGRELFVRQIQRGLRMAWEHHLWPLESWLDVFHVPSKTHVYTGGCKGQEQVLAVWIAAVLSEMLKLATQNNVYLGTSLKSNTYKEQNFFEWSYAFIKDLGKVPVTCLLHGDISQESGTLSGCVVWT